MSRMRSHLEAAADLRIDYAEVVDRHTLLPQSQVDQTTLLAVAAWVGDTRLIDNLPLADVLPRCQP